jgi:hypothetical protein
MQAKLPRIGGPIFPDPTSAKRNPSEMRGPILKFPRRPLRCLSRYMQIASIQRVRVDPVDEDAGVIEIDFPILQVVVLL